jgi:Zn-finger nucleic acid-binding protein
MQLSAKGYFVCSHCGTTAFPSGADHDGLRVLGPGEAPQDCPACQAPLVRAMIDEYQVAHCEKCRGMLMPRRSFAEVVRRRRAWAEGPPVNPIPPEEREIRRQLHCPRCEEPMIVDRYYGPGNIIMDSCPACDLVWLDYGELKQVIDAPGLDRGSRDLT